MKVFIALCIISVIGLASCGVLPVASYVGTPSLESAVVRSDRLGGSFSYSTVQTHGYSALAPVVQPVSYTSQVALAQPTVYTTQPIYSQKYYQSFLTPQLIAPQYYYPGLVSQTPVVQLPQNPIFGQQPVVGQNPIYTENPVQGQYPIADTPVIAAADSPSQQPAGSVTVDDDTVSVESA